MFDLRDLGDMSKLASQAKELQKQQDIKQAQQNNLLTRIADTLDDILAELKGQNKL